MSELTPQEVLADLFEELLVQNPEELAATVLERLRDAGFAIVDWKDAPPPRSAAAPEEMQPCELTRLLGQ